MCEKILQLLSKSNLVDCWFTSLPDNTASKIESFGKFNSTNQDKGRSRNFHKRRWQTIAIFACSICFSHFTIFGFGIFWFRAGRSSDGGLFLQCAERFYHRLYIESFWFVSKSNHVFVLLIALFQVHPIWTSMIMSSSNTNWWKFWPKLAKRKIGKYSNRSISA